MTRDLLSSALIEARLAGEVASLRWLEALIGNRLVGVDVGETHAAVLLEIYEEISQNLTHARAIHAAAHDAMVAASPACRPALSTQTRELS